MSELPCCFTVAIRAYNSASRLPTLLDRLQAQSHVEGLSWEVLVIDNNSVDATEQVVRAYQAQWPQSGKLRYCLELRQGAVFARQRAILEARGEWIGFLDDDNLPAQDWVAACWAFGLAYPRAGAYGSQIHGLYEVSPPADFDRIAHFLPVIERPHAVCFTRGLYARKQVLPPGAGLVIRRRAWLQAVPEQLRLLGPVASSLQAKGEDIEALTYLKRAGWEIWFNPEMHIYHCIGEHRLQREYLLSFFRGIGLGRYYTRMLGYAAWQQPWMVLAYLLNDLRKLAVHVGVYRWQIRTNVVAACEWQLYCTSLLSPFYWWWRQGRRGRQKPYPGGGEGASVVTSLLDEPVLDGSGLQGKARPFNARSRSPQRLRSAQGLLRSSRAVVPTDWSSQ